MSIGDKIWDSLATLMRVGGDVAQLRDFSQRQQKQIEQINLRLVRLETVVQMSRTPTKTIVEQDNDSRDD